MAKYEVKHKCGHVANIELFGETSKREYRMDKMSNELCAECYKEKMEIIYKTKENEAMEQQEKLGLPNLAGTERQIKWAVTIRQNFINEYNNYIDENRSKMKNENIVKSQEMLKNILDIKIESELWIKYKDFDFKDMVRVLSK